MRSVVAGAWKLIQHDSFPSGAKGLLIYNPDGHMSVVITGETPSGKDQVIAYAGTYSVDDNVITHHVQVSDNPSRLGQDLKRYYSLNENRLVLSASPGSGPGRVEWELYCASDQHMLP